ncbi:hypothetical protein TIFTF001_017516 [Ficus carica]|uniref:Uncharacterized protein n=1 Tax=Ficus carica TaxID=3494 RepID=A0AA88D8D6_FICCA|nr:hypothetical protein TIFTF001_017516 [Ficus carica]
MVAAAPRAAAMAPSLRTKSVIAMPFFQPLFAGFGAASIGTFSSLAAVLAS